MRTLIKDIFKKNFLNKTVTICGWVKTVRTQKTFSFIEINDGSFLSNMQIIASHSLKLDFEKIKIGTSLSVTGEVTESPGIQKYEIKAEKINILGECDKDYPLQKKKHSFEFLRTILHLRPRTNTQGAIMRIRNSLAFATHKFFQERDFLYIQTPIITSSDCEGSGELFRVTTLGDKDSKKLKDGSLDFSTDFFKKPTFLTVSGQLNAEAFASSLSKVYTFGPTFRAENSNTSRHLSEFWMIEPEMAFVDINENIEIAESYLKYIIKYILENNEEEIHFFEKFIKKGLLEKLNQIVDITFEKITYTEAIDILKKADKKFEFPIKWGIDLQSEHERYLSEEHFYKPVVVKDYPEEIKAFYMRLNDDKKTVAAMDILFPKIGEIIGGSQREERFHILQEKIKKKNLEEKDYKWYLDLRRYGSVVHSGFGLGFERLVQFVTGIDNIRDVIPFPRYPSHAEF
ncbi:MAG: asparaginyl-tRNA synthetase [Chlamydiae bacterium SM23_39]|nr:MAG: asparaginyl-tRNA synthetase [Chlamydiae bacterium SM23_39]